MSALKLAPSEPATVHPSPSSRSTGATNPTTHLLVKIVVGLTVWVLIAMPVLIVLIVAEAGRRTSQAIARIARRIRAGARPIMARILTLITGVAMIGGMIIIGGCADLPRTVETRIDEYGNLAVLECVGKCLHLEFDEIVPASAQ